MGVSVEEGGESAEDKMEESRSNDSSTAAALLFVKKAPKADPYEWR